MEINVEVVRESVEELKRRVFRRGEELELELKRGVVILKKCL